MTDHNDDVQAWWDKLGFKDQRALLEQSHNEPLSTWLTEAVETAGRSFDSDRGRLTAEEWTFIGKQGDRHGHEGHDHGHHTSGGGGL